MELKISKYQFKKRQTRNIDIIKNSKDKIISGPKEYYLNTINSKARENGINKPSNRVLNLRKKSNKGPKILENIKPIKSIKLASKPKSNNKNRIFLNINKCKKLSKEKEEKEIYYHKEVKSFKVSKLIKADNKAQLNRTNNMFNLTRKNSLENYTKDSTINNSCSIAKYISLKRGQSLKEKRNKIKIMKLQNNQSYTERTMDKIYDLYKLLMSFQNDIYNDRKCLNIKLQNKKC